MLARSRWSLFLSITGVLIVLISGLLIALRFSLPGVGQFRPEVEQWLNAATGQKISIGSLDVIWHGWTPELVVKDIRLSDAAEDAPRLQSLRARIGWDPLAFRETAGIHVKRLDLSGVSLTIVRRPNGSLHQVGMGIPPAWKKLKSIGFLSWLLRQPRVDMKSANIHWHNEENENASFFMPNAHFSIYRDGSHHRIRLMAHPQKDVPSKGSPLSTSNSVLSGIADITVNPTTWDWSGSASFEVENLNLQQFPFLQSTLAPLAISGVARFGLRTSWNNSQLEQVEGDFALRDVVLGGMNTNTTVHERHADLPERENRETPLHEKNQTLPARDDDELSKKRDCMPLCALTDKKIKLHKMQGYLKLARIGTDNWQLDLPRFTLTTSRGEWPTSHARLKTAWLRNDHGGLLKILGAELENEDIIVHLTGTGQWFEDHSSPDLRLVTEIEHGRLDKFTLYLPTDLMKDSLIKWFRHAFPKGELTQGRVLFHGRIADFPFDNGKGIFEARAKTQETTLNYAKSWPPVEKMAADIVLRGRRLTITANSGFVHGANVEESIAEIPDILAKTPTLMVYGHAVGTLNEGLAFLREGPLATRYATRVAGISGSGRHRLDLEIQLPLIENRKIRTQGSITFLDNTLQVNVPVVTTSKADDTGITLYQVNGALTFDEHGIVGKSIVARYLDRQVTIDVVKAENTTQFTMKGLDTHTLLAHPLLKSAAREISPSSFSFIKGIIDKVTWQVILDLPDDWGLDNQAARLRIVSPLYGTMDLPAPLSDRPFHVEILLGSKNQQTQRAEQRVRFQFGSGVTGIFSKEKLSRGNHAKWRGAVRLGAGQVTLPKAGFRIDGHVSRLFLNQWRALLLGPMKEKSTAGTRRKSTPQASPFGEAPNLQAEISSDEFIAFGRTFQNATFRIDRDDEHAWHIQVRSDEAQGHIRIPGAGTDETITVALTHLQLPLSDDGSEGGDFDLGDIPPLRLACENLTYNTLPWGEIRLLELSPTPQGLEIKRIEVTSENFRIQGHGSWEHAAQPNRSRVHLKINGTDLGKLLSSFGYHGDVAKKGKTSLQLDLQWPGSLTQFQLEQASGTFEIKATKGRLLAIEPGATGRAFGLLSITLLPRRLLLDFRDIFQEGLVYDRMEGTFKIHKGKAETNNFFVEGPTSRVQIVGNTGLTTKEYDQIATVTPKLASSIPLAVIGIAQKLVDNPFFDKAFTYRYTIKGTWDHPEIERVGTDKEAGKNHLELQ